jgi:predicted ATP-grasp superfamily ATP-dependent carboligase
MERVLVLDASQRSALATVRSLGRLGGIELLAADSQTETLAGSSRYCRQSFRHPPVREQPRAFMQWLLHCIEAERIDLVMPMTEFTSQLILMHNQARPDSAIPLPFADQRKVLSLADKGRLVERARSLDIACPDTRLYASAAAVDLDRINAYPVVIKPCRSQLWLEDHWLSTSVQIARDRRQLQALLERSPWLRNHAFLLQDFIPGHGAGIFALYDRGRPVAFFSHRRLREKPPSGGVSVLSESVPPPPAMLGAARRLLDDAGWHGVAMVEFRVDQQGKPWLMEVNTRFWGSLQLAIDAGVDFPLLLYRIQRGETVQPVSDYRSGRRLRWLLGDIDHLYLLLRSRDHSPAFKLRRLLQWLLPHPLRTRHEVDRWSDPGPAITELRLYLADLRGKDSR